MEILATQTGGESYKAHKYSLDHADRPEIDYTEDENIWDSYGEKTHYTTYVDPMANYDLQVIQNQQLFSYFLDGSRRTFKVDDIAYKKAGGRRVIYPIVAGQIGIGCCKRIDKRMTPEKFHQEFVIAVPDIANADRKAGFSEATIKKINDCPELKRLGIRFGEILTYKTGVREMTNYEDLGTAQIQFKMSIEERNMVKDLVSQGKLNQYNYLVKDGSLEYRPTKQDKKDERAYRIFRNNYRWVIGVSKNFNPQICWDKGGKPNPGFIADLPLYYRTPVARYKNPNWFGDTKFAVWYIRLKDKSRTRTPFDGVVKVEKMLVTEKEMETGMDSEEVDYISACLIKERNPVCYGSDLRWANHIYPIYLTEKYVKSKYLSAESFLHIF